MIGRRNTPEESFPVREVLMEKKKRILALAGVIILVALYLSTLIFALIDSPWADTCLKAAVGATILVPVLLYGYILIYRLIKKNHDK